MDDQASPAAENSRGLRLTAKLARELYERLVALKDCYDPTNFFRVNQNIPPSGSVNEQPPPKEVAASRVR